MATLNAVRSWFKPLISVLERPEPRGSGDIKVGRTLHSLHGLYTGVRSVTSETSVAERLALRFGMF
jgi:hypothetical protein